MKHAAFITARGHSCRPAPKTWERQIYNRYDLPFEPGDGILTVKKSFPLGGTLVRAAVRATALGVFELFLNGERIGSRTEEGIVYDELKPGWTDYRFRVLEYTYEITGLCREDNLFVAEVSPGWWSGRISYGAYGYRPCAFRAEIELVYEDGSSERIVTGEDWEAAVCGPVLRADLWDGEYYDARIPHAARCPEAQDWSPAIPFGEFGGVIEPAKPPFVQVREALRRTPCSAVLYSGRRESQGSLGTIGVVLKKTGKSCERGMISDGQAMILDMGQNMVGHPRLVLRAERGTRIEVFFAEMLNDSGDPDRGNDGPKGSLYLSNYRSALARLVYIASGEETECYAPTHAFFGFRYLEIRADRPIQLLSVTGEVMGSALNETGRFACDNPEVNRLYENIVWGMRGNYLSVPTDCPQRDERLGWSGDTQIFCGAASYLADTAAFLRKWLGDARDSQKGCQGGYGDVIPRILGGNGNAAWGDAGLIVPYRLWLMYGEREILEEHYDSMEEYMRFLAQYGLEGPNTTYGDWLNYDDTDKRYIAVCYYAYDALLMEKISAQLGKESRAAFYHELREQILRHFEARYLKDGAPVFTTQTACLLPLSFGMTEGAVRERFIAALREAIERNDYTLSTGFVGTGLLNQTLSSVGLDDLCYDLLLQTKDPSWLYSVRQGATTVWERWNSYTHERGFGDVSMNSFNHYAYGAVAEWFYAGICGIIPDENAPGFRRFFLRPTPDTRTLLPQGQRHIGAAEASYDSRSGRIESGWKRLGDRFEYRFVIPDGTSAEVGLFCEGESVVINGLSFDAEELSAERRGQRLCFRLGAGVYTILI